MMSSDVTIASNTQKRFLLFITGEVDGTERTFLHGMGTDHMFLLGGGTNGSDLRGGGRLQII